jgi:hopanoid-associated phosphorylase
VSVICTHASQLIAALDRAARRGASGIISFGIAGGLAPHLAAGDWVVGSSVRTDQECFPTDRAWARALLDALPGALHAEIIGADAPVAHPLEKRRLHARTGAVAVDNESHVAARIAAAYRIPFAACRAVIDPAHSELPPAAVTGLRHDGTADVLAVLRSVVRQPSQIPALARTALEARTAGAALRRGRRLLGVGLAFPYFREVPLDASRSRRSDRSSTSLFCRSDGSDIVDIGGSGPAARPARSSSWLSGRGGPPSSDVRGARAVPLSLTASERQFHSMEKAPTAPAIGGRTLSDQLT